MSFTLCSDQPAQYLLAPVVWLFISWLFLYLASFHLGLFFTNLSSLTYLGLIASYYWIYKLPHSPSMKFLPTPSPLAVYIMRAALYGVVQKHSTVINIKWRRANFLFRLKHWIVLFIIILGRTAIRFAVSA